MNYGLLFSIELQKKAFVIPAATAAAVGGAGAYLGDESGNGAASGAGRALGGALLGVAPGYLPAVIGANRLAAGGGTPGTALAMGLGLASNIGGIGGAIYGAGKTDKPWWYYPMRGATFGLYK